jgi:transposase
MNRIKALLRNLGMPTGTLWNAEGMTRLRALALPMNSSMITDLWRGELHTDLSQLEEMQRHLTVITERLDQLVEGCAPARTLAQLDGIGPRTAEAAISTIDDSLRFTDRKKIGSYLGAVPRVRQSGAVSRYGGITKADNAVVRTYADPGRAKCDSPQGWLGQRYLPKDPPR